MTITKAQIKVKYPEVYEFYTMQAAIPEAKYQEKLKFWESNGIQCFERWTVPYFMEREKEKKRPCLRLNYPEDGKCNECVKGVCRYDRICFMCGNEGHGASQSFPGGKMKGKLKCVKHRNCLNQLSAIKSEHGMDDEDLKVLFQEDESLNKLSVNTSPKLNAHGNSVASSNSIGVISPPSSVSGSPSASSESYQPRSNIIVQGGHQTIHDSLNSQISFSPQSFSLSNLVILDQMPNNLLPPSVYGVADTKAANSADAIAVNSLTETMKTVDVSETDEFGSLNSLQYSSINFRRQHGYFGGFASYGSWINARGIHKVQIRGWVRKSLTHTDNSKVKEEIKAVRILSTRSVYISKILHIGTVELIHRDMFGNEHEIQCIISEMSEYGTLDCFLSTLLQIDSKGFSTSDLQNMFAQLIEGLIWCEEMNVTHRDLRPCNILVAKSPNNYQQRQFSKGLILKLSNFTPTVIPSTENQFMGMSPDIDCWYAPEASLQARIRGTDYKIDSDAWSLGLVLYYLSTNGLLPFESYKLACDSCIDENLRRSCLGKDGLEVHHPKIFDLVERLLRPQNRRISLRTIRCHPFLWSIQTCKDFLISFANTVNGPEEFYSKFDKICPLYVFGQDGWAICMSQTLLSLVQPTVLISEYWRSGRHLLQAIRNQLNNSESLQSVYPSMSSSMTIAAYIRRITDMDYPRLLILIYELGGIHGKWQWDGDEITHSWN